MSESNLEKGSSSNPIIQSDFVAKKFPQFLAVLSGAVGTFGVGSVFGWSSGGGPSMESTGDFGDYKNSSDDGSWVASIVSLGCLAAVLSIAVPLELIGRKYTMLALSIPALAGWLIMGFATNIPMMLAGRFITGYAHGAFTLLCPIYAGEVAENSIRGILGNLVNIFLTTGILFAYTISAFMEWNHMSFVCAGIPVVLFVAVLLFVPESPRFLVTKGRDAEALQSLMRLRGATMGSQVEDELATIRHSVETATKESVKLRDLTKGSVWKPTAICMMLMVLQQMAGNKVIMFYAKDIYESAHTGISTDLQPIIMSCVQVSFVFVSTMLIERLGRKILLTVSAFGMCVSLTILATYFYLQEHHKSTAEDVGWLPLASLVLYQITFNLGLGPLPWTVMGEMVPLNVKGLAGAMACGVCWGLGFVVAKTFPSMQDTMHTYGAYYMFSSVCLFGTFFCFFVMPETKGKSVDEIQAIFKKR